MEITAFNNTPDEPTYLIIKTKWKIDSGIGVINNATNKQKMELTAFKPMPDELIRLIMEYTRPTYPYMEQLKDLQVCLKITYPYPLVLPHNHIDSGLNYGIKEPTE